MNKNAATVTKQPASTQFAAVFNLDDPAERFIVDTMQRFHGEDRLYRAHAIKRITSDSGERIVVEVAEFRPPRRPAEWMLIYWNVDNVSIHFHDKPDSKAAYAAYDAM